METPTELTTAPLGAIATSEPVPADDRLVTIIVLQDDEFDEIADLTPEMLTEHLARWDYGDENDGAATINGYARLAEVERFGAQPITHDNLNYWYLLDRDLRIASLLRRPLTPLPPEDEDVPDGAPEITDHRFIVTVSGCNAAQAAQVIAERISSEEDYGFPYEIGDVEVKGSGGSSE